MFARDGGCPDTLPRIVDSQAPLSIDQLASEAGVTPQRVQQLRQWGLVEEQQGGGFTRADVGRINVIEELTSKGIPVDELARASREGAVSFSWFGGILPPLPGLRDETYEEMFDRVGVSVDLATRLFEVWGVAMPALSAPVREDDARLVEYLSEFLSYVQGQGDVLVEATRYFGDNARRNTESQIDFFRRRVVEPLLARGLSLKETIETVNHLTASVIRPGVQELVVWLHRRHINAQNMQMLVQMVENALEEAGVEVPRSDRPPAIVFIDLSGFTRRTDQQGDQEAADLAARLSDLVRAQVARNKGSVVKFLGDGVMLYFPDPTDAIRCARQLTRDAVGAGLPPARAGMDVGTLIFRDGDYFGRTVNVAARIADYARPGEVLISEAAAVAVAEPERKRLRQIGPISLKGLADPVQLHVATDVAYP